MTYEIEYLDAQGAVVGNQSVLMHTGAAGPFNVVSTLTTFPSNATHFRGTLSTQNAGAVIIIIILSGCPGTDSGTCTKKCPNGETVEGVKCGGFCEAVCPPEEKDVAECSTAR